MVLFPVAWGARAHKPVGPADLAARIVEGCGEMRLRRQGGAHIHNSVPKNPPRGTCGAVATSIH